MKYATEVLDLMAAAPGRPWRMAELVRGASGARDLTRRERNAMRQAILRVLETLHEGGQVARIEHARNSLSYVWSDVRHGGIACAPDAARQCIHVVAPAADPPNCQSIAALLR
ncbi:MAG: hypothetical protein ACWGIK_14390 [Achromobacter pulmonis]|nr:hypothetical protein [Achromobacter pulmonis]